MISMRASSERRSAPTTDSSARCDAGCLPVEASERSLVEIDDTEAIFLQSLPCLFCPWLASLVTHVFQPAQSFHRVESHVLHPALDLLDRTMRVSGGVNRQEPV